MNPPTPLGPDEAAADFLQRLRPNGPWVLSAIAPDGPIETATMFTVEDVHNFVATWNGERNLYYLVNRPRGVLDSKARKQDTAWIDFVHADLDPHADETPEQAKKRYRTAIAGNGLQPSFLVDSGNGIQALWALAPAIELPPVQAPDRAEAVAYMEELNKALALRLGGTAGTQNIDRILRLPGTTNIPNAKKRREGRVQCAATLLEAHEDTYPIDAFPQSEPAPEQHQAAQGKAPREPDEIFQSLDAKLQKEIQKPPRPDEDRSETAAGVVWQLMRCGCTNEEIIALFKRFPQGIGARYTEGKRLKDDVQRLRQKFEPQTPVQHAPRAVDLWGVFEAPPLPRGVLPKVIEQYAFEQGKRMGCDPAGLAISALTVCAAAIPDRIVLQMKIHDPHWFESARIWTALVGHPSTKKSPLMRSAAWPLIAHDIELFSDYSEELTNYMALSAEERKAADRPQQKRLRIEDTTIEGAQDVLLDSPDGVLCLQDELAGWFGSMDKYTGARGAAKDRGFWMQSYNGGSYAFNRVKRGAAIIPNLSICVLGGIQPEPIRELIAEAHDDGLIQRLFTIVLKPATMSVDEQQPAAVEPYNALVEQLFDLQLPKIGGVGNLANVLSTPLRFDTEAQELRAQLEQKHVNLYALETFNKKLSAHIGKYDGLFGRLCVLFHCIENVGKLTSVISYNTANRVAKFLHEFLLPHAIVFYQSVLGLSDDHDRLTALAGYILAHKKERMTNRDVAHGDSVMRALKPYEIEALFDQLDTLGWLTRVPANRANAPPHWIVNPYVHEHFRARAETEAARRTAARALIAELVASMRRDKEHP